VRGVIRGGIDAVADAIVLRVSEPEFEAVPGDKVSAALLGTAGAQLSWGNGLESWVGRGSILASSAFEFKPSGAGVGLWQTETLTERLILKASD